MAGAHPDIVRLGKIEQRFLASRGDLRLVYGDGEPYFAAGPDVVLVIGPDATAGDRDFYFEAYEDVGFLLNFAARALRHARHRQAHQPAQSGKLEKPRDKPADYAAECAMKCTDEAFRTYLRERHALASNASDDDVVRTVREALDIKSRRDLNLDPEAAKRWRDMVRDFDFWRQHG